MIRKLHVQRRIACPFYTGSEKMKILKCEGLSNTSLCVTDFEKTEALERWLNSLCCQKPQFCPIYKGLSKGKYNSIAPPLHLKRDQTYHSDLR